MKLGAAYLSVALLCACTRAPDWTSVHGEAKKPIKRVDVVQTIAGSSSLLVAATQSGALLISTDAGANWTRKQLANASLIDLAVCPNGNLIGIDFYQRVWSGNATGDDWLPHKIDRPKTPLAVTCDSKGFWWVVGTNATIATSTDQGKSWRTIDLNADAQITTIQFVDELHGFALGEFGMVIKTEDGGSNWVKMPVIPEEFYPYAALFIDRDRGWASGIAGRILATRDGGKTWQRQNNESGMSLYRLFLHQGVPHGVGAGGTVARWEKDDWRIVYYPDAAPVFLGAGSSLPSRKTLVIGGPGGLLRTFDTSKN